MISPGERERLLESLLTGELDETDGRVKRLLEQDPELRRELLELEQVIAQLDSDAAFRRSSIEEAQQLEDATGHDRVEMTLRRLLMEERTRLTPPPRSASRRVVWIALAAAAAGLLIWILIGITREPGPSPELVIGGERSFTELSPEGPGVSFEVFRWSIETAGNETFRVVVTDGRVPEDEIDETVLTESGRLIEPRWFPAEDEIREWPDEIRWQVLLSNGEAVLARSDWVWAQRSR